MQILFLMLSIALYVCGSAAFGQAAYVVGNGVAAFDPVTYVESCLEGNNE